MPSVLTPEQKILATAGAFWSNTPNGAGNLRLQDIISKVALLSLVFALLLGTFFLTAATTKAQASDIINFQSKIVDKTTGLNVTTGSPSCVVAGADTCDFRASIHSDSTGGTQLWEETHSNVELGDVGGIFNLDLNSVCASWDSPVAAGDCGGGGGIDWGADPTLYIEIEFDTDGNGDFTTPETFGRKELTSVPYAYYADTAGQLDGIDSTGFVQLEPSAAQVATGTDALIWLNETGASSPNLLELETGGVDQFTIGNGGGFDALGNSALGSDASVNANRSLNLIDVVNTAGANYGLYIDSENDSSNIAADNYGMYIYSYSLGNEADIYGTYVEAWAGGLNAATTAYGTYSLAYDAGKVYGGYFEGAGSGATTDNYGIYANGNGINGGGLAGSNSYGGYFIADNGGTSSTTYGLYADAVNTGITGTAYGLYLGTGVDSAATGYAIYSTATSDSYLSGDLGIGVTSPDAFLDIKAATTASAQLNLSASAAVDVSAPVNGDMWWNGTNLYFYDGSSNEDLLDNPCSTCFVNGGNSFGSDAVLGTNDGTALELETNGVTRLEIANNGTIGIGTTPFFRQQLRLQRSTAYTTDEHHGVFSINSVNITSSGTGSYYGVGGRILTGSGAYNATKLVGVESYVVNDLSGTIGRVAGLETFVQTSGAGTVGTVAGLYVESNIVTTATVTANAGIYIEDIVGGVSSSDYGIYLAGADDYALYIAADKARFAPATTSTASIQIATSGAVDVSAPVNGDMWWNGTNLYFYDGSSNQDLLGGGSSLFTDGGTETYLTATTDDFVIGASTLVAPFSVDVSANLVRFGTGSTANAQLNFYASDADTGSLTYTTNDQWAFSGGDVGIGGRISVGTTSINPFARARFFDTTTITSSVNSNVRVDSTFTPSGASTASIDGIQNNFTLNGSNNATGNVRGLRNVSTISNTGTRNSVAGLYTEVNVSSGSDPVLYGSYTEVDHSGTSSATSVFGDYVARLYTSSNNILSSSGTHVRSFQNSGTGTINVNYGIYVGNQTAGNIDYGLFISAADTYALYTGEGDVVFNGNSADSDFTILGDTDSNLFFVDASSDSVGIGVAVPDAWLDIKAATTASAQLNLSASAAIDPSTPVNGDMWWNGTNLYFYDGSSNQDLLGGSSSLFTDGGTVTYLTATTDDFAIGASTLVAPFSVDVDTNVVRIGDGTNDANDPTLTFYASDATASSSISVLDGGVFEFTNSILPSADDTYDLGSTGLRWQDVYIGPSSLHIGVTGDEGIISYNTTSDVFDFSSPLEVTTLGAQDSFVDIGAATTGAAQINFMTSAGINPSAPNNGDMWWNGTNLYFYDGSTSQDLLGGGIFGNDGTVTAGGFIDVVHNQGTSDVITDSWVFDTESSTWKSINGTVAGAGGVVGNHDTAGPTLGAWWELEESSGSLVDSSGNGNTLSTINGSAATYSETGQETNAVRFNGDGDGYVAAHSGTLNPTDGLTIGGWVKFPSTFSADSFDHDMSLFNKGDYELKFEHESGKLVFEANDSSSGTQTLSYNPGAMDNAKALAEYNGKLYAGFGGASGEGDIGVYDPGTETWSNSYDTSVAGTNYDIIYALVEYGGNLYAATGGAAGEGDVLVYNGSTWSISYDGSEQYILSLGLYNGNLYAGESGAAASTVGEVLQYNGSSWTSSYVFGGVVDQVWSMQEYNGNLYVGVGDGAAGAGDIYTYDGSTWSLAYNQLVNDFAYSMAVYDGMLWIGFGNDSNEGDIWTYDGTTWSENYTSSGYEDALSLAVYDGRLYAGMGRGDGDGDIRVYDGTSWSAYQANGAGSFDQVQGMTEFEGTLWYTSGIAASTGDVYFKDVNEIRLESAKTSWTGGTWYHVAAVYKNGTTELFVDGVSNASVTDITFGGIENTGARLFIGGTGNASAGERADYTDATLDELFLYKDALTSAELSTIVSSGQGALTDTGDSSLIAYWNLDEASGNLIDGTDNLNDFSTGTNSSPTYAQTGQVGNSVRFNGDGDYFKVTSNEQNISLSDQISIGAWVKFPNSFSADSQDFDMDIINKGDYKLRFNSKTGKLEFEVNDSGGANTQTLLNNNATDRVEAFAHANGNFYTGHGGGNEADIYEYTSATDSGTKIYDSGTEGQTYDYVHALIEFEGKLYAAVGGVTAGDGDVIVYDGTIWTTSYDGSEIDIYSLATYNGKLYAGESGANASAAAEVLEFNGSSWSSSFTFGGTEDYVYQLQEYNGDLYASSGTPNVNGDAAIYKFDGSTWTTSYDSFAADVIYGMAVYDGRLFAGLGQDSNEGDIWEFDGTTWTVSNDLGGYELVWGMSVYNNKLYVGMGNSDGDGDVYEYDGETWTRIQNNGIGNFDQVRNMGEAFGHLYYSSGAAANTGDLYYRNKNEVRIESNQSSWAANTWYHITGTLGAGSVKLYVDGVLDNSSSASVTSVDDDGGPIFLGGVGNTAEGERANYLNGWLDEVFIYSDVLTSSEIESLHGAGSGDFSVEQIDNNTVRLHNNSDVDQQLKLDVVASGVGGGGSSLFADSGALTYLSSTSDDFAIGGTSLSSPLSVDVDTNIVRIGDGVSDANDPTLEFYASDSTNSGTLSYADSDAFVFTGGTVQVGSLASASATHVCIDGSNNLSTCSSSERYKENIQDLTLGLDTVEALRPVSFDWKSDGRADLGFIAEEVALIDSSLVFEYNGQIEGVNYSQMTAVLANAVQEQQLQIDAIENMLLNAVFNNVASIVVTDLTADDLNVIANAIFGGNIKVTGTATFEGKTVFKDKIVYNNQDMFGQAKFIAGHTKVEIVFSEAIPQDLHVQITSQDFYSGIYRVTNLTQDGFTIELSQAQLTDIVLNWTATRVVSLSATQSIE